jgi:tRNA(fMet)-specific endonuclease VapC
MKRYILDTGIVSDLLNDIGNVSTRVWEERRRGNRVGTVMPVVAELYFGAENSATRDENLALLARRLSKLIVWPFERQAAEEYGRLATELRRIGKPIQVIDMMTASIALTMKSCIVVSKDSDFKVVPGLKVENWSF